MIEILTHKEVAEKIRRGKLAADEFNKKLDDGTNLMFDNFDGCFHVKSPNDPAWAKAAWIEWAQTVEGRGPDKPRFAVGDMGTVWMDLPLAGKSHARVELKPERNEHGHWTIIIWDRLGGV